MNQPEEETREVPLEAPALEDLEVVEEEAEADEPEEEAIAPAEPQYLTQKQLGDRLVVSRQYVAKLEKSGKLGEMGWERVPGTGGTKKTPLRYRPISG